MVVNKSNINNKNTIRKSNNTSVRRTSANNKNISNSRKSTIVKSSTCNNNRRKNNNVKNNSAKRNTYTPRNTFDRNKSQQSYSVLHNKKVIKKKKLKIKNIIILMLIVAIFSLIPIYFLVLKLRDSDNDATDDNNEIIDSNNDKEETKKDKWDIIQDKLDFYNPDFKERYIAYYNNNPSLDLEMVVVYVNIGLDNQFYTNISSSPRQNTSLVLANKYYNLDSSFVPSNLETINSKYSSGNKKLVHEARIAFEQMAKNAKLDGYTIRAVSTYRSYSYQKQLYSNYVKKDGVKNADTYSARAGHSEHQTGLAVDVDNAKLSYTSFGNTKEFKWMLENAHKYGFILRYTKDNEFITGYKDEPWHYRYVGVDIATYIYENPMTYEEYYVRFLNN